MTIPAHIAFIDVDGVETHRLEIVPPAGMEAELDLAIIRGRLRSIHKLIGVGRENFNAALAMELAGR